MHLNNLRITQDSHIKSREVRILVFLRHLQVDHDLCDAPQHGDEVENVPRVSKVVLQKQSTWFLI